MAYRNFYRVVVSNEFLGVSKEISAPTRYELDTKVENQKRIWNERVKREITRQNKEEMKRKAEQLTKSDNKKIEEYKTQGKKIVAIDAALLIEDNYLPYIDKLILVTCKKDIQIKRIIARDNCTEKEAISRINSQMSQEDKAKFADYIIDNSGSFENLEQQVLEIISVLQGE